MTHIMSFISNVKISVLFQSNAVVADFFDAASKRNITCVCKRNFLAIKDKYSVTVFRKYPNKFHLNVTGIQSLSDISNTIRWLVRNYCDKKKFKYLFHKIDNITATFNTGFKLSLHVIASRLKLSSYNPEIFPGLHFKTGFGTCVIFSSGKTNILGCKCKEEVLSTWQKAKELINVTTMKKIG